MAILTLYENTQSFHTFACFFYNIWYYLSHFPFETRAIEETIIIDIFVVYADGNNGQYSHERAEGLPANDRHSYISKNFGSEYPDYSNAPLRFYNNHHVQYDTWMKTSKINFHDHDEFVQMLSGFFFFIANLSENRAILLGLKHEWKYRKRNIRFISYEIFSKSHILIV